MLRWVGGLALACLFGCSILVDSDSGGGDSTDGAVGDDAIVANCPNGLLSNPDFEDTLIEWETNRAAVQIRSEPMARSGSQVLHVASDGTGGDALAFVPGAHDVLAGETYRVTTHLRCIQPTIATVRVSAVINGSRQGSFSVDVNLSDCEDWLEVAVEHEFTQDAKVSTGVEIEEPDFQEILVDDVCLEQVP